MKLLVIEDNRSLVNSLKRYLGKSFVIDAFATGEEGLQQAQSGSYDVIILDLGLPDKSGREICAAIRGANVAAPILILTGKGDISSRVELLEVGADDYVTKPFHLTELRARLTALTRRLSYSYSPRVIEIGDLTIDLNRRQVQRAGVPIRLRRKEFDILEYLVRNRGRAVTRAMILDYAWEADTDGWNNTVDVHIKHLRDKIDRPFATPLIKTAYGIGYMLDDVVV